MADPTFASPERRSFLIPILLALALLAAAGWVAVHFYPATTVNIAQVRTEVLPTHTVYPSKSIVLGPPESTDELFVATTLRIDNQMRAPIDLDDFECTLTDPAGAVMTVKAATRSELANMELSFPKLRPLVGTPMVRDESIDPGKQATGTIVLAFPFTRTQWDARKSAVVKVSLYHLNAVYQTIPKG